MYVLLWKPTSGVSEHACALIQFLWDGRNVCVCVCVCVCVRIVATGDRVVGSQNNTEYNAYPMKSCMACTYNHPAITHRARRLVPVIVTHQSPRIAFCQQVTCNGWIRDPATGKLTTHNETWPNGFKSLVDYAHAHGVKIGECLAPHRMTDQHAS